MNWLNWFGSRARVRIRRPRRAVPRRERLDFEQLEERLPTNNLTWDPLSAIDISAVHWGGAFVVAGSTVEFSIVGTGEDWDTWHGQVGMGPPQWGQAQDIVTITWSGASCVALDGGKRASCTLGSAGAPGLFHMVMHADDAGGTPAGDFGSRNDAALEFNTDITAIWTTITGKFDGIQSLDNDSGLCFCIDGDFNADNTTFQLGIAEPSTGEANGFFNKVELTATVSPAVPDGTREFEWEQMRHIVVCSRSSANGSWGPSSSDPLPGSWDNPARLDSPVPGFYTDHTVHNKVFMIDSPGIRTGPQNNWALTGGSAVDRLYFYGNFHTRLSFNNQEVASPYDWHVVVKLTSGVVNGQLHWILEAAPEADDAFVQPPANCQVP